MVLIILRGNPRHQESLSGGRQSFFVSSMICADIPCPNNIPSCVWSICAADWYLQSYHIGDSFVAFLRKLRFARLHPSFPLLSSRACPKQSAMRFKVELLLWRKHSCLSQTGVTEKSKLTGGSSSHCIMGLSCKDSLPARRILYK